MDINIKFFEINHFVNEFKKLLGTFFPTYKILNLMM